MAADIPTCGSVLTARVAVTPKCQTEIGEVFVAYRVRSRRLGLGLGISLQRLQQLLSYTP